MPEFHQVNPEEGQGLTANPSPVLEEGNDDMLRQELIRIKTPGLFLGVNIEYPLRPPT
jgi:hypothetical protein